MKINDRVEIHFKEPRPVGSLLRWEGLWGRVVNTRIGNDGEEDMVFIEPGVNRPDGYGRADFWWPVEDLRPVS